MTPKGSFPGIVTYLHSLKSVSACALPTKYFGLFLVRISRGTNRNFRIHHSPPHQSPPGPSVSLPPPSSPRRPRQRRDIDIAIGNPFLPFPPPAVVSRGRLTTPRFAGALPCSVPLILRRSYHSSPLGGERHRDAAADDRLDAGVHLDDTSVTAATSLGRRPPPHEVDVLRIQGDVASCSGAVLGQPSLRPRQLQTIALVLVTLNVPDQRRRVSADGIRQFAHCSSAGRSRHCLRPTACPLCQPPGKV